jgi:hypothetical protein
MMGFDSVFSCLLFTVEQAFGIVTQDGNLLGVGETEVGDGAGGGQRVVERVITAEASKRTGRPFSAAFFTTRATVGSATSNCCVLGCSFSHAAPPVATRSISSRAARPSAGWTEQTG